MGVTYKAYDTNLRSPAALKVINSSFLQNEQARERFLREARAAAQLRHPNVATIYHLGHEGVENYFYAMELIEGETFEELVKREGPLRPAAALELTLQVTRALIAAHAVGLIHRDIKPSNLMLTRHHGEPLVKVIDFGLAKAIGPDTEDADGASNGLTRTVGSAFVGTPYYASPEQLEGLNVDARSDIYSLGITLWYLLSAQTPFQASSMARVISEHLSKPPPFERLGTLPECVVALLRRMLEKDPAHRHQTPTDLRDEIFACLRQLPPSDLLSHTSSAIFALDAAPATQAGVASGLNATMPDLPPTVCEIGPLNVGATLEGRFKLGDRAGTSTFRAADRTSGVSAMIRLLTASAMTAAKAAFPSWQAAARDCPSLLTPISIGFSPDGGGYVALEWLEGSATLLDLMRQRGAVTLGETLAILEPIAGADLELRRQGLHGVHLDPMHILIPAAGSPVPAIPRVLPAEIFPDAGDAPVGNETILQPTSSSVPSLTSGGDPRAFGRLACELLGGPARNWLEPGSSRFTPLSALNEAGNNVLRRSLSRSPDSRKSDGFSTGAEFVAALRRSVDGFVAATTGVPLPSAPLSATRPMTEGIGGAAPKPSAPLAKSRPPSHADEETIVPAPRTEAARKPSLLVPVLAMLTLFATAGIIGAFLWKRPASIGVPGLDATPTPATAAGSTVSTTNPARPRPAGIYPLKPESAWTNTLGMQLVPAGFGSLHAAIWPVRTADFAAFVAATQYDATGGMYSVGPLGRRGQLGRSWKDPGFTQGADHPVVGVNVADAEAFCAWLTKVERDAGLLPGGRRYRLPTDEEWSTLAGLKEQAASLTPDKRSDRAGDIYPWGAQWPPPAGVGNYAGKESALPEGEMLPNYNDGFPRTAPVGSFPANALGLFDMGGNVWQWCSDRYKDGANWRVVRGGSWLVADRPKLRLGARDGYNPAFRHDDIGFRCVLAPEQ